MYMILDNVIKLISKCTSSSLNSLSAVPSWTVPCLFWRQALPNEVSYVPSILALLKVDLKIFVFIIDVLFYQVFQFSFSVFILFYFFFYLTILRRHCFIISLNVTLSWWTFPFWTYRSWANLDWPKRLFSECRRHLRRSRLGQSKITHGSKTIKDIFINHRLWKLTF